MPRFNPGGEDAKRRGALVDEDDSRKEINGRVEEALNANGGVSILRAKHDED